MHSQTHKGKKTCHEIKLQQSNSQEKARINELNNQIRKDIATYREDSASNLWISISTKTPDKFWPTVRKIMKSGQSAASQPPTLNGTTNRTPEQQSTCFYELNEDIHSVPTVRPGSQEINHQVDNFIELLKTVTPSQTKITEFSTKVTPEDIQTTIKRTRNTAPARRRRSILRPHQKPAALCPTFPVFYEQSLESQYFPAAWKKGTTILLPNDPTSTTRTLKTIDQSSSSPH
jgi:hypothetical protein